ncbi:unnamed protein product [Heterobilharzia americana]|nr:unnamed protein product [Heterobilharzia americana]
MYISVLPYAQNPSVRKLSKIATLLLAKNYILLLTKSVKELQEKLDMMANKFSMCQNEPIQLNNPVNNLTPVNLIATIASSLMSSSSSLNSSLSPAPLSTPCSSSLHQVFASLSSNLPVLQSYPMSSFTPIPSHILLTENKQFNDHSPVSVKRIPNNDVSTDICSNVIQPTSISLFSLLDTTTIQNTDQYHSHNPNSLVVASPSFPTLLSNRVSVQSPEKLLSNQVNLFNKELYDITNLSSYNPTIYPGINQMFKFNFCK